MGEKKDAIRFYDNDEWKGKSIYFMGDKSNEEEIVITSDDREYVRGDKLCVEYNGIQIYADLNQVVYINQKTNVIYIKENKKLSPPEEREYLVLLSFYNEQNTFQGIVGRQDTFDYLKSIIETIDIGSSMVLAETVAFKDSITVYEFMKRCIEDGMVQNDDGFDIEEYYCRIDEE